MVWPVNAKVGVFERSKLQLTMKTFIRLIQRIKLSIRWKLLFGFLTTNFLLIVALIISLTSLYGMPGSLKSSYERTDLIKQIEITQSQMVTSVLDYVWTESSSRLNEYYVANKNLVNYINTFQPSDLERSNYVSSQ